MNIRALAVLLCVVVLIVSCKENPLESIDAVYLARAAALGFDPVKLNVAENQAAGLDYLSGLMILRNDSVVSEHYYHGADQSTVYNVKSVSKSFLSALVGIALHNGDIPGLDRKVCDYFPEYFTEGDNPLKKDISLQHLLTMSSGLSWQENGSIEHSWMTSRDWIKSFVELPAVTTPGSQWNYTTAGTHTLSAIITRATGMSTMDYAQLHLFGPAGITVSRWDRDYQGYYWGGSEMYFTLRNMAALGVLYLNDGYQGNSRIVPSDWVRESTSRRINVSVDWMRAWGISGYGYLWWLKEIGGHDVFFAWGYGGQFLFVVPDLRMAAAMTSSLANSPDAPLIDAHQARVFELMEDYIDAAADGLP